MNILIALCVTLLLAASARAELAAGSTREEVIAQYGRPASESKNGPVTTLVYPLGVVHLRDGKVTDISAKLLTQGGPPAGSGMRMPGGANSGKVTKKGSGRLDLKTVLVPGNGNARPRKVTVRVPM